MKSLIVIAIAAVALLTAQLAQASTSTFAVVPQVGAASFKIGGSGLDSKSGMLIGANVIYTPQGSAIGYETGINYLQAGAKTEMFFASAEYNLNYIAVPIYANWNFYKSAANSVGYVKAGALVTQLSSAKAVTTVFGESQEQDIADQVSKNDVMLTAGLGGRWSVFGGMLLGFEGSYIKGTQDVAKDGSLGKSEGFVVTSSLAIDL